MSSAADGGLGGDRHAQGPRARPRHRQRLLPARRRIAEAFGADEVIDPRATNPHSRWRALGVPVSRTERSVLAMSGRTGKRAIVFECVGVPGVIQGLIEGVPVGTQVMVVGVCMQTDAMKPFPTPSTSRSS
ncbi:hypothetical protein AB5I41_20065 [Sphingomonas sp. MMS24-JH45]